MRARVGSPRPTRDEPDVAPISEKGPEMSPPDAARAACSRSRQRLAAGRCVELDLQRLDDLQNRRELRVAGG